MLLRTRNSLNPITEVPNVCAGHVLERFLGLDIQELRAGRHVGRSAVDGPLHCGAIVPGRDLAQQVGGSGHRCRDGGWLQSHLLPHDQAERKSSSAAGFAPRETSQEEGIGCDEHTANAARSVGLRLPVPTSRHCAAATLREVLMKMLKEFEVRSPLGLVCCLRAFGFNKRRLSCTLSWLF